MFNFTTTTKSVLLVAIMLVAAAGGALAAAPTVDTETTNTSTTTELNDGGTQAYNQSTTSLIAWSADSEHSKIEISQDGDTLYAASPSNYSAADTDSSGSLDTWYFNVSVADDGADYSGLDANAGESVTLNVTLINNTEVSNPDTTNISYTFANGNVEAFEDVDETSVQTPSDSGTFSVASLAFWSDNATDPAKTDATIGVTGNETETVTLSVAGTPMAEAFSTAAENTESGDVIWSSATSLDDEYVVVANSEAPDTDWFNDSQPYATYDEDAQTLTYHNVDELTADDAQDLEISATGNDGLGLTNTASMLTNYDATWSSAYGTAIWNADFTEPDWEDSDE
ncbi:MULTISPECIES: hypothetical protein [Halolamina]|uniref:Uncharacterized protein n=1 Tax=Halolamina pelagica TaxID=699431 RepID=A0A1I5VKF5_9EURY|nr:MULTISPECIES: hypothetical protein [Halolamina]NHX37622.1 hypothetical protein [Halolamina sp. R1-12]SFQ08034.1 hypothetical protein SAMN05216277_11852 [Halolamina pelagica]